MKKLAWWFRITGIVYLVLGALWLPTINAAKLGTVIPGFDGPHGGTAYRGFLDYLFMFGLEMLVVGAFLILASWRPRWQEPLVWLIVALSAVRGVFDDAYMIAAGYPTAQNVVFIVMHVAIGVTGILFLRSAKRDAAFPARSAAAARGRAAAPVAGEPAVRATGS